MFLDQNEFHLLDFFMNSKCSYICSKLFQFKSKNKVIQDAHFLLRRELSCSYDTQTRITC